MSNNFDELMDVSYFDKLMNAGYTSAPVPNSQRHSITPVKVPIKVMKVCEEEDCKLFTTEIPSVNWGSTPIDGEKMDKVMMFPYFHLSTSIVIDSRCLMCTRCKKVDIKQEIKVLEAMEALAGENDDN